MPERRDRGRRRFTVLLAVSLLAVTLPIFCRPLRPLLVVSRPLSHADAIVLLAGDFRERAPVAARLYREGIAPRIILTNDGVFSGWSQKYQRNLYNVEWAAELLSSLGVPRQAVISLPFTKSGTIHEAAAIHGYCQDNGIHAIQIVTSDYHTRRALWTFRHLVRHEPIAIGIVPVPIPPDGLANLGHLLTETSKCIYYYLRYRGWFNET